MGTGGGGHNNKQRIRTKQQQQQQQQYITPLEIVAAVPSFDVYYQQQTTHRRSIYGKSIGLLICIFCIWLYDMNHDTKSMDDNQMISQQRFSK